MVTQSPVGCQKQKNPGWSNTIPSRLSKLDSHTIESMIKHCNPRMVTQSPVGCQKQKTQDGQTPFPVDCQKIIGQSYHRKCGNPHDYRMVTIFLSKTITQKIQVETNHPHSRMVIPNSE